jgi:hypothetical protein
MFGNNRDQLRKMWADAWHKFLQQQPLQPLEQQLVDILHLHPEYHALLDHTDADYLPELGQSNPFLHMGLHMALREQIATDRPAGIRECFNALLKHTNDPHETEHRLMECLAEAIWQAQRTGQMPDESAYLQCLKQRSGKL